MLKTNIVTKLNRLSSLWSFSIIFCVGLLTYCDGLKNQFQGDDNSQIVLNPPVHSLANIKLFFEGGTFYNGHGLAPLTGVYFRPLQTTIYSLLYTVFGPNPLFFHIFQLLLCIGSAFFLYLIFKLNFKPGLALFLALLFLILPINSQTVFSIPNMQDALYFFFGIASLWVLFTHKSRKSLFGTIALLCVALLAKETAALFILMTAVYLFQRDRKRLYLFLMAIVPMLAVYVLLRFHAIGWLSNPNSGPIDRLDLAGRITASPAILLLYLNKLVFPWKLSSAYFWDQPHFSVRHVLLPLLIDLCAVGFFVYRGLLIRRSSTPGMKFAYNYFALWTVIGILLIVQIIPLDFTASAPWFYFTSAGILGMAGLIITDLSKRKWIHRNLKLVIGLAVLIIILASVRTALWGRVWSSPYALAKNDLSATQDDYSANFQLSVYYFDQQDYVDTLLYAHRSVADFPYATNYNALGTAQMMTGEYGQAQTSFSTGLKYFKDCNLYDNMSALTYFIGSTASNTKILTTAIGYCPADSDPWLFLAILEYKNHNLSVAQYAVTKAYNYAGGANSFVAPVYNAIMSGGTLPSTVAGI